MQIITLLFHAFLEYRDMKKILLYILTLSLLSSCTVGSRTGDGVVGIIWVRDGAQVVRGVWVCIDEQKVLTSAHVVRDDTINYELRIMSHKGVQANYEWTPPNATWIERDENIDIAYMRVKSEEWRVKDICRKYKEYIWKSHLIVWESVSIPLIRSGSVVNLTGMVTSLTGMILAYDTLGRTQILSGIVMTDISLAPWDSGAPILDKWGRVVDVVHVR